MINSDPYPTCVNAPCATCRYNTGKLLCEMEHYEPTSLNNQTDFEKDYSALVKRFASPVPGAPATSEYVIEECAELIQAIQHARRGRKNANPVKEMAHVYTLLDALRIYWEISDEEIRVYKQELIDRYLGQPNDGRHVPENLSH